jgi:hypothetical protein
MLRGLVDRIAEQLAQRYGAGKKTDLVFPGALWDEVQHWTNALGANERQYHYIWESRIQKTLPQDVETIFAGALAYDMYNTSAVLEYSSPKLKEAELESERNMADLL